jgi:effector-binding domain-containing protein
MMEVLVALAKKLSTKSKSKNDETHNEQVLTIAEGSVLRVEVSMSRDIFQPLGERQ